MSAAARAGRGRPHVRAGYAAPLLSATHARLLGFAPLAAFCAVMWARMLEPPRVAGMLVAAAIAVAVGVALGRAGRLARAGIAVATAAAVLLAAGVAPRLLWPGAWEELAAGVGGGLGDLPVTNIPYRGADEWTVTALLLIGALLLAVAAWLAFAPRRSGLARSPLPAALVLVLLFAIPAVQAGQAADPWLDGVPLALLLCVFLRLERVERHAARAALAVVVAAGLAAALVAPRLDTAAPLLDPDAIARAFTPDRGLTFSWNHDYGALGWPRTGRELLRIRAEHPSYWKVENLSRFDGLRWVQPRELRTAQEANIRAGRPEWLSDIHVRVRGLISRMFVGAGTTIRVSESPRIPIRNAPGTFRTGPRPLRTGHSYDATVWTPRPSRRQLRAAHGAVPDWTWPYLRMDLPAAQGGPVLRPARGSVLRAPQTAQVSFAEYGEHARPTLEPRSFGESAVPAGGIVRRSAYGGVYRLALRLRKGTETPYEYVRAVLEHLAKDFTYTEQPPRSAVPLAAFLTGDRAGYCQQFSGAMALLLRMGGVPARVSTGFSPGTLDRGSGEYVVRDTDAHSWVEAYLAPYGWVTFDPTPPVGPARLTAVAGDAASPYQLAAPESVAGAGDRVSDPSFGGGPVDGGGPPVPLIGAALVALAACVAGGAALLRRRRRRGSPAEAALAELRAALACTGRAKPELTLAQMAHRYRGTPAEQYLRTLQAARFGGEDAVPTPAMRAALRRELTIGLGPVARLAAWRAMPPALRPAGRSRARASYPGRP